MTPKIEDLIKEVKDAMQRKNFAEAHAQAQNIVAIVATTTVENSLSKAADAIEQGRGMQAVEVICEAEPYLAQVDRSVSERYDEMKTRAYSSAVEQLLSDAQKWMSGNIITEKQLADALRYCDKARSYVRIAGKEIRQNIDEEIDHLIGFHYDAEAGAFNFDDRHLSESNDKKRVRELAAYMIAAVNTVLERENTSFRIGPGYEREATHMGDTFFNFVRGAFSVYRRGMRKDNSLPSLQEALKEMEERA